MDGAFALGLLPLGHVVVGIQPARGYHIDPAASYHDPDLPPPHGYLAFYAWLRQSFGAHAVIHMGKHGNLEWLPGKALALAEDCLPEAVLGPVPHIYPFIVNDPGEGSQAKRRSAAVIVDHLTPPLTRAESYGPLAELERLVDEYYDAAGVDPRRTSYLRGEILALSRRLGLDRDVGIAPADASDIALAKLDNHLCELKELQIRDGLHEFGKAPAGAPLTDLLVALVECRAAPARAATPRCCGRSRRTSGSPASTRWTARWPSPGGARGPRFCEAWTGSPGAATATRSSAWSSRRAPWSPAT